ncbi:hypothetical protein AWC32_23280 [Mycobacterium xenopi]|uniref:Uncharacterized protein n=1 Tax=Mycobacterium xenopi TaxID=1789 RepID=A0AAD1H322_MYCXE|nr:hypothetical protein I552_5361 [Mycobacterium xenopi 3993]ORX21435.1 hypothetical protein AWC32_23280 [Mycobacterium xenopi]BBU23280.1 hypothetical protein MYXE_30700 [Mycobacterium xenopi]SPX88928.1 Uncharacterised protein [Mycobacterium xenopi]
MRLRPKRFRAAVSVDPGNRGGRHIALTLGPALQFELDTDEARDLALALVDAIEAATRRPQC